MSSPMRVSGPGALPVMSEAPRLASSKGSATAPVTPPAPSEGPSAFANVLHGLGREITSGESMMRTAEVSLQRGADMSPNELIALQVGAYKYSDAIDLASRLVDRVTNGVKTVIQGGGQ